MKPRSWIVFSGYLWFFSGILLLYKGLKFIAEAAFKSDSVCSQLSQIFGSSEQAATALIAFSLMIGFIKGRFVFSKTVRRVVTRIASLQPPIRFKDAYTPGYWIVIGIMMTLGMSLKYLPISLDVRGVVDVAVGSALINGAFLYFKAARAVNISA